MNLFIIVMAIVSFGWALTPGQMKALDEQLRAGRPSGNEGRAAAAFTERVDELEKRMLPLAFLFNRLGPVLVQRMNELESVEAYLKKNPVLVNPYGDQAWVQSARRETAYVCCDVRRSPRLAQEIQENLAQGLPALSDSMSEKVGSRAKNAAMGRALVEYGGEEIRSAGGRPAVPMGLGGPLPLGGGPPPSARKGLSTGVISGLPAPSGAPPIPQIQGLAPPIPVPIPIPNTPPPSGLPLPSSNGN